MNPANTIKLPKNSERMLRLTLIVAGTTKFRSHGAFAAYYLQAFTKPGLRIIYPLFFTALICLSYPSLNSYWE